MGRANRHDRYERMRRGEVEGGEEGRGEEKEEW